MDDLDHSMNIAEFDWSSFYDESEECVSLPQPALARPDDLSDSDDSLDSSSVFSSGSSLQGAPQDAKEADSGVTESDCAGRLNESGAEGAQVTAGNTEVRLENVEDVTEARGDVSETLSVECSEVSITRDNVQKENAKYEPSPLNVKEPHTAIAEKERWFVTVDYRPVRPRGKKKRRQKKTCRQEKPPEEEEEEEDAVGGRASFTESNQELSRTSGRHQREENFSEDENEPKPGRSHDTFTSKALAQAESAESDEFSSVHSYDSESYVTAAESAEEARHRRPVDLTRLQSSSTSEVHCFLSGDVAAVNRDGNEDTADARRALTFPSAGADADSMCDDINTHSAVQKHDINPLSRGSCSSGDRLGPVPDSPETYADAAGLARPVFAISAFWNDMEKVTINDILQLRMSRGTATEHADETSHSSPVELSDSDYFTQPDESKPERSSCEFSTSDVEEDDDEYWQFVGVSRNASTPDLQGQERPERTSDSSLLSHEEEDDESTSSEGTQTPVPLEDFAQESHTLSTLAWSGQMTKSKSTYDVQVLNKDDDVRFGRYRSVNDETAALKDTLAPGLFLSGYDTDVLDEHFPEVFECFFTEDKTNNNESGCITVYNPDELSVAPVFDYSLCPPRDDVPPRSFLHDSLYNEDKPIPIFSCSPPTIREMTFPNSGYVFLEEADDFSPIRVVSCSFVQADQRATQRGSCGWKTFLNTRKIGFHARGSIWGRTSGSWMFPPDSGKAEGKVFAFPQVFGELQPSILETKKTARQEGIFSTLKQSDMCLVCIAFASWVLRSSDPENADTWKAALLANVSALSAIQYLRHYVKRKPRQDDA